MSESVHPMHPGEEGADGERWGQSTARLLHETADYAVAFLAGLANRRSASFGIG